MRFDTVTSALLLALLPLAVHGQVFNVVQDYSGPTFFEEWDFFGNYDNLTGGMRILQALAAVQADKFLRTRHLAQQRECSEAEISLRFAFWDSHLEGG